MDVFASSRGEGGREAVRPRFVDGTAEAVDRPMLGGGRERAEREVGESEARDRVDEYKRCE